MIDTSFLRQLDRFNLIVRKRITSSYSGGRRSDSFGRGLVFKDYREYVAGDDFRLIDWKVYARTDNLFIRRYEEERSLTVHIIIDGSSSMDFGKSVKKFEYASMIGLGFAYMAMKNNERFVFSTFAEKLNPFRARKGRRQLVETVSYLNDFKVRGKSNFKDSIESYKQLIGSRSLIIIISDFLFDIDEIRNCIIKYKKSDMILLQVLDPTEKQFDYKGDLIFHDAETNEVFRTFISNRIKQNYKAKLQDHIDEIQEVGDRFGAEFVTVTTDKPIFDTIFEVLK